VSLGHECLQGVLQLVQVSLVVLGGLAVHVLDAGVQLLQRLLFRVRVRVTV